jgi:hypothetical protein
MNPTSIVKTRLMYKSTGKSKKCAWVGELGWRWPELLQRGAAMDGLWKKKEEK